MFAVFSGLCVFGDECSLRRAQGSRRCAQHQSLNGKPNRKLQGFASGESQSLFFKTLYRGELMFTNLTRIKQTVIILVFILS